MFCRNGINLTLGISGHISYQQYQTEECDEAEAALCSCLTPGHKWVNFNIIDDILTRLFLDQKVERKK